MCITLFTFYLHAQHIHCFGICIHKVMQRKSIRKPIKLYLYNFVLHLPSHAHLFQPVLLPEGDDFQDLNTHLYDAY